MKDSVTLQMRHFTLDPFVTFRRIKAEDAPTPSESPTEAVINRVRSWLDFMDEGAAVPTDDIETLVALTERCLNGDCND
jgi:hypothetical protein